MKLILDGNHLDVINVNVLKLVVFVMDVVVTIEFETYKLTNKILE